MKQERYCLVSGVLFLCVATAHLLRIVYGMSVQVADVSIPMLASWMGFFVATTLAVWAFRITRASSSD